MTISESVAWVREFQALAGDLLQRVDVLVFPAFTALWAVAQELDAEGIQLGAQNMSADTELARSGQISAALLMDVGCKWVSLGHWEVRRYLGDDEESIRRKLLLAFASGLRPLLLVGEAHDHTLPVERALAQQLAQILSGCRGEDIATMGLVYEPEKAIGVARPATADHVAAGCGYMRRWLAQQWGPSVAEQVRIVYGGSVGPEFARELLAIPDVDGLGATRRGRDPSTFAEIVRQVAEAKAP